MPEYERPLIEKPTEIQIAEFHRKHGMKKIITLEEINKIKVDFVRSIMPDRVFKSKSEVIEVLKNHRFKILNLKETERSLIQSMITVGNIPNELIEEEIEVCEIYECPYFCPSCNERMADMKNFRRTTYGKEIVVHTKTKTKEYIEYQLGHLTCPNEFQVICINRKCVRYGYLMDIEILNKSMKIKEAE